jgi:Carboxypeptidase regulatory-like domain
MKVFQRRLRVSRCPGVGLTAIALLVASFSAVSAQSIDVTVTHGETGGPLQGAFVSVLAADSAVLFSGLTDASGRVGFRLATVGTIQVKAGMIGHAPQVTAAVTLHAGESHPIRLVLPVLAVDLAEIRVEADDLCRLRPDAAMQISSVWESARTALGIQTWAEQHAIHRLNVSTWERDLDSSGGTVERETRRSRTRLTRTPFRSLPPEDLLRSGFARSREGGDTEWFAPDAALLLSDEFLNTHCFRLTRSAEQPGSIGLAFSPVRSEPTDIEGTLWLDEQSGYLQHLDYRYTSPPLAEARGLAHGHVDFEALPSGAWIIRRWWIRVPILARDLARARGGDSGIRLIAIREVGGEVTGTSALARAGFLEPERGSLGGLVWDSVGSAPLHGARVQLAGTDYAATSGADGRFILRDLPAGAFRATFTHPKLDSLAIVAAAVEAEIVPGRTADVVLAIPSLATILLSTCETTSAQTEARPVAAVSGVVADAGLGEPIPGATVRVEWQEVERTRPRIVARNRWFEVRTDAHGRYTACGIPVDEDVTIRAVMLTYASEPAQVRFAEPAHRPVDLTIALPHGASASEPRANVSGSERSTQGIQGELIDVASGEPVRHADVVLRSATDGAILSTTTDAQGVFRLQPPLAGRYIVEARALGYRPLAPDSIDLARGRLAIVEIRMVPDALELQPVFVTTERRVMHLETEGFYRRRSEGLGVFMTPEIVDRRKPRWTSDLLFGVPGTNVAESTAAGTGRAVYFRSGIRGDGRTVCWPMIYVNRQLVSTGGLSADAEPTAIDALVAAADIAALEVYRSPAEVPPAFNGPNAGCGVIVLWTRRGGSDP